MNKQRLILTIIMPILWVLFMPQTAMAFEEADSAAKLSIHVISQDWRVEQLHTYLVSQESPLVDEAQYIVDESDRLQLDWRLIPAIAGTESTFGKFMPPCSYNAWGWGIPTGSESGVAFKNWRDGITTVAQGIRYDYIDEGAKTVEQISYRYAASSKWASHVEYFMHEIETFAPSHIDQFDITI